MRPERNDPAAAKISVKPESSREKVVRRTFPGPRDVGEILRVAIDRRAYADFTAHAKEFLEVEVCGVLVGQTCEDDEGRFVHVEAVIRGTAASQAATHVTFTQATWEAIHETLERDHPKARIVGWYHTHPGFGVEFSEMDMFIHRNFFPSATQVALVTDPVNGDVALATNSAQGIAYLPRFWVDAREQGAKVPAASTGAKPSGHPAGAAGANGSELLQTVKTLEGRVSQLLQAHDEQRASFGRFLYTVGFVFCGSLIAVLGYLVYQNYSARLEPPRLNNIVPVPVQVGDKAVLLGVGVFQWDVPPELNALMLQMEKIKAAEEAEAAKKKSNADSAPNVKKESAP